MDIKELISGKKIFTFIGLKFNPSKDLVVLKKLLSLDVQIATRIAIKFSTLTLVNSKIFLIILKIIL